MVLRTLAEKFNGIIWKIETDASSSHIAIETRDAASKAVHFSAFNYATGKTLIREVTTEHGFWWSLDRIYNNTVFLHGYMSESSPEHKGIIALDIHTGAIKWQVFHLSLHDISEEGLIAYNPLLQLKKLQLLDFETGEYINSPDKHYLPVTRNIVFPDIVNGTSPLPAFIPENIAGPLFYTKISEKECWSFHMQEGGSFSQVLLISSGAEILQEDILASGIQKLNPEAFFIQPDYLFAVKGSNHEIVCYLL
ncbi:DUF4905 domain-containing protein [Rubrolithibacter danxiaensis]|uniref:DUF4905 domain-containing protein n=1 Tax=Rubrolithibacter danxiaensis TaxID=3390805 RepID=UPI003BF782E3